MALDTFTLIASQYALEEDALEDYDAVRAAYEDLGIIDTYDAAVVTKGPDGKVRIVERIEEPTRHGAIAGLAVGLAVGALVAIFPAVALGAGLAIGGASGAALGATAGHVVAGMSRSDLKDLGGTARCRHQRSHRRRRDRRRRPCRGSDPAREGHRQEAGADRRGRPQDRDRLTLIDGSDRRLVAEAPTTPVPPGPPSGVDSVAQEGIRSVTPAWTDPWERGGGGR